jgi:hypothetical protein
MYRLFHHRQSSPDFAAVVISTVNYPVIPF